MIIVLAPDKTYQVHIESSYNIPIIYITPISLYAKTEEIIMACVTSQVQNAFDLGINIVYK